MKKIIDNFSEKSSSYKKFRPTYPDSLYEFIMTQVYSHDCCWDCGTGNGQVANVLANYFDKVYASDISENQLKNAESNSNVTYSVERAEQTQYSENSFDLITVAQAVHWFDFEAFNKEMKRVAKDGALVCIWGYGLLRIDSDLNEIIDDFYINKIGSYWNNERKHIDAAYSDIGFDFEELDVPNNFNIIANWQREHLLGYLNTWSSVRHYKEANEGANPVADIQNRIYNNWDEGIEKEVKFPVFMRMGRIIK